MTKKSGLKTPDWITEGYDSKADWEKAKSIHKEKKQEKNSFKKMQRRLN